MTHFSSKPSHQTTKFAPTRSIHSSSASHVRMIKLQYYSLTVIQFSATIPYVYPELRRARPAEPTLIALRSLVLPAFHYSPFTISLVFILLRTLLRRANSQLLSFQNLPHSLRKTPGVGVPHHSFTLSGVEGPLLPPC